MFAYEGPPVAALLGQVATVHRDGQPAARQVSLGYLAAVLRTCAPASRKRGPAAAAEPQFPA